MRVRRGNQHPVRRDAGALRGQLLRFVEQFAPHHAAIDDHEHRLLPAVGQGQRPRIHASLHFADAAREHAPVDEHRQSLRRHVDHGRTGPKFGLRRRRHRGEKHRDDAGGRSRGETERPQTANQKSGHDVFLGKIGGGLKICRPARREQ